jgi:hypothetical protein
MPSWIRLELWTRYKPYTLLGRVTIDGSMPQSSTKMTRSVSPRFNGQVATCTTTNAALVEIFPNLMFGGAAYFARRADLF